MTKHIRNVYSGEQLDLDKEIALGVDAILFKGGQGEWADYPRVFPDYVKNVERKGLPWGITWQADARYSPERHKAGLKQWYPNGNFGPLGLWFCIEYPYYAPWLNELTYWTFPYANYKNYESVWRGVFNYTGKYPGIYTSVSKWNLIFGSYKYPDPRKASRALQEEFAMRSDLMVAQYKVLAPTPFGAWDGAWSIWQHQENPDMNVCSDEWFAKKLGNTLPPPPEPKPQPLTSITVHVRTDGRAELVWSRVNGAIDSTKITVVETEPFPVEPPTPEPEPNNEVIDDIQYGVLRFQRTENELTLKGDFTPATVQLQDVPKPNSGKGATIPVHKSSLQFMRDINDDLGYKYCQSVGAMWINIPYDDILNAHGESVSCMTNFISWNKGDIKNGCYRIRCFQSSEDFQQFDPKKVNWFERPELFIKAQSVNLEGDRWMKVKKGIDCYIPLMARSIKDGGKGELWLTVVEVEPFHPLPITVTVTTEIGLNVRKLPTIDSDLTGSYLLDETAELLEYRPKGNTIWARTVKGWICLRLVDGSFTTTWTLETFHTLPAA